MIRLLFLFSGACALVYQVAWMRMLAGILGHTTAAVSIITATFMAGLGAGAVVGGRLADRFPDRTVRIFGLLEGGIGFYALAFPFLLDLYSRIYLGLTAGTDAVGPLLGVRMGIAALAVLPATLLMGATFPILCRGAASADGAGREAGILYGINTLGAVLGTLAAGFFLVRLFGIAYTTRIAAAANLAIASVALLLLKENVPVWRNRTEPVEPRRLGRTGPERKEFATRRSGPRGCCGDGGAEPEANDYALRGRAPRSRGPTGETSSGTIPPGSLLLVAFLLGAAGLSCEVLWTRGLVLFIGGTIPAFAAVLAVFLAGIGGGGLLGGLLFPRLRRPEVWLAGAAVGIGIFAILSVPLLPKVHTISQGFAARYAVTPGEAGEAAIAGFLGTLFVGSAGIVAIPAILSGFAFALAVPLYARREETAGSDVGRLYAANTVGAIVGAVAAYWILIPLVGTRNGILAAGGIAVGAGLLLTAGRTLPRTARYALRAGGALTVLLLVALWGGAPLVLETHLLAGPEGRHQDLVHHEEDPVFAVSVLIDERTGDRTLATDGFVMAGVSEEFEYIRGMAHVAASAHPDPERALVLCLGTGTTAGSLALHAETVRVVDLSRAVRRALPWFAEANGNLAGRTGVEILIDDARHHLARTEGTYDLIALEPPHPALAGAANLYAQELYDDCLRRLAPGGVLCQWMPYHNMRTVDFRVMLSTFLDAVPHAALFYVHDTTFVLGGREPPVFDAERLAALAADPAVREDLARIGLDDPLAPAACLLLPEEELRAFVGEPGRRITDDDPYTEYVGVWNALSPETNETYRRTIDAAPPLERLTESVRGGDPDAVRAAFAARREVLEGIDAMKRGEVPAAIGRYVRALELRPEDAQSRHRLRLLESTYAIRQASAMERAGDLGEAERLYRGAIERRPEAALPYLALAQLLLRKQEHDEALAYARRAAATAEGYAPGVYYADAHVAIAACLAARGDPHGARTLLREILDREPDHPAARGALAILRPSR